MILKKRVDHLHIIRGIASFLVVCFHARFILWCGGAEFIKSNPPAVEKYIGYLLMLLFSSGQAMVICFFVLSGFFMQLSYDVNPLKKFFLNRIIRIYVPYIANSILACLILYLCFNFINPALKTPFDTIKEIAVTPVTAYAELNISTFVKSLVFLPGKEYIGWNSQYWSLLYEAIFYLTIPLLMLNKTAMLVLATLTYILGFFFSTDNVFLNYLLSYLIFFQIGICLHKLIDWPEVERIFSKKYIFKIALALCLFAYLLLCFLELLKYNREANLLGGLLAVLLILVFYHQRDAVFKVKLFKWLKKLGDVSFSLYLTHFLILYFFYALITKLTGIYTIYQPLYILAMPFTVAVSYCFYELVEKPSLQLKKFIQKKESII